MRKVIVVVHVFLLIHVCMGEGCISTFADLEHELLTNPANKHQLSRAFFPLRHEISPVCVTSYYYVGINSSSIDKASCSSVLNISDEGEEMTGCTKWRWCTNSFYVAINLPQLEDFSFYIILDATTDVTLELPPLCGDTDHDINNQHFLRATASLYQYARNKGQLGNGTEFVGYAAGFTEDSDSLKKLTYNYDSQPDAIRILIGTKNYVLIDLKILHKVVLSINLYSLPMFTTFFILFAHLDYIKSKKQEQNQTKKPKNVSLGALKYYLMFSFVVTCGLGIVSMAKFQFYAIKNENKIQKFYIHPYIFLWIMVFVNFITSTFLIIAEEKCFKRCLQKCIIMSAGTITMQLASWHLVFVLYGLILNPLRAFLYSVAIIIAVLWSVIFWVLLPLIILNLIFFLILCIIYLQNFFCFTWCIKNYHHDPCDCLVVDCYRHIKNLRLNTDGIKSFVLMLSLIVLLYNIHRCFHCVHPSHKHY